MNDIGLSNISILKVTWFEPQFHSQCVTYMVLALSWLDMFHNIKKVSVSGDAGISIRKGSSSQRTISSTSYLYSKGVTIMLSIVFK